MNDYYNLLEYLNNRLTELHWFYSPITFADSIVNFEKISDIEHSSREHIAVLDRNIFSRIINVITTGTTKQGSTKDIAIFILWCAMNHINIMPYYALNEYATGQNSELKAQNEYNAFQQMFEKIDIMTWMTLATGLEKENKTLIETNDNLNDTLFNESSIDYLTNFASLLHFEYVWRTEKDNVIRFKTFFQWYYNNLKVSRYMTTYICSVLLNISGYTPPKKIESKKYEEFIGGCQNQARDICYLTSMSIDRIPSETYELILITDDKMLGDIFEKGCFNVNAIRMFEKNIKQGSRQISNWVDNLLINHSEVNPINYMSHCNKIIDEELRRIKSLF